MDKIFTLNHVSIISGLTGTVLIAFSVRRKGQYDRADKRIKKVVKEAHKRDEYEFTYTTINKYFLWTGLACIALGAILQW